MLAIQLTKSLMENQTHVYHHVPSCVKKTNSTVCRYNFPQKVEETSAFDAKDVFHSRRRIGNQWLNSYVPVWRQCFRDNMDAKLICDGNGAQKCLYCTKYCSKHQSLVDNIHVIEMAYEKKVQREDPENEKYRRGLGRLLSLAYASSGSIEVGGPLAAHYILRGEAGYFSHDFVPLLLTQTMNVLENENTVSILEPFGDHYKLSSGMNDYLFRDERLKDVSLTAFCSWYKKKAKSKNPAALRFKANHIQADTHMLERTQEPRIPEIMGPRVPDNRHLDDNEIEAKYYKILLCLYKPFVHPNELIEVNGETVSPKERFQQWLGTVDAREQRDILKRLEYHQEYYFAMDGAKKYHEQMRKCTTELACDSTDIDTDGARRHYDEELQARARATVSFEDMWCCLNTEDHDLSLNNDADDAQEELNVMAPDVQHLIPPLNQPQVSPNAVLQTQVTGRQVKQFLKELLLDESTMVGNNVQLDCNDEVKMITLNKIMEEIRFTTPTEENIEERPYPTVNEVSARFTLNALQHVAFTKFAVPVLHKLMNIEFTAWDSSPLYVTGAGGTGKSRIVNAILYLVKQWGRPNSVRVMAPTGVAAAALGGTTLHSAVSLPIRATSLPSQLLHPSVELLEKWQGVVAIIVDENSMIGKCFSY